MVDVPEVLEVMRSMLHCLLEIVDGALCSLEVPELMQCVLPCMLEVVDGALCLREVLEVPEMMRCRCGDVESGGLEARFRYSDVEI